MVMKLFVYKFIQCTWGCIQSFIGFILYLVYKDEYTMDFHGSIVCKWNHKDCVSLGMFIFMSESMHKELYNQLLVHEYGHTIQSLLFGPFYLIVIGIPSFLWCRLPVFEVNRVKNHVSYYSFWIEKWASSLGERVTGMKAIR